MLSKEPGAGQEPVSGNWKEEKCREREEPKREALQREAQPPVLIPHPPVSAPASHPSAIRMPREQFCLHVGAPAFSKVALNPVLFCYLYHGLKGSCLHFVYLVTIISPGGSGASRVLPLKPRRMSGVL